MLWRGGNQCQGGGNLARRVAWTVTPSPPYSCSGGRSGPPARAALQGHFTHRFRYRADNGKRLILGGARVWCLIVVLLAAGMLTAGEHRGVVKLGTLPVPGATVTARQGEKTVAVLTDLQGAYVFPDLADGK